MKHMNLRRDQSLKKKKLRQLIDAGVQQNKDNLKKNKIQTNFLDAISTFKKSVVKARVSVCAARCTHHNTSGKVKPIGHDGDLSKSIDETLVTSRNL